MHGLTDMSIFGNNSGMQIIMVSPGVCKYVCVYMCVFVHPCVYTCS